MIGIVNTSALPCLAHQEFVQPLLRIVKDAGFSANPIQYTDPAFHEHIATCNAVILAGTYIQDNDFLGNTEQFAWLRTTSLPVLGICAGAELIASVFGATVTDGCEIGLSKVTVTEKAGIFDTTGTFSGYCLHSLAVQLPESVTTLAYTAQGPAAFHVPNTQTYGVMFHPEVRNHSIITAFLRLQDNQ